MGALESLWVATGWSTCGKAALVRLRKSIEQSRLSSAQRPACRIRLATCVDRHGHVAVEISDTGVGIPADVLPRIFDPFFTTKPVGVGTGLGLSICHSLISAMGGSIEVASKVGVGTRFLIVLPAIDRPALQERAAQQGT